MGKLIRATACLHCVQDKTSFGSNMFAQLSEFIYRNSSAFINWPSVESASGIVNDFWMVAGIEVLLDSPNVSLGFALLPVACNFITSNIRYISDCLLFQQEQPILCCLLSPSVHSTAWYPAIHPALESTTARNSTSNLRDGCWKKWQLHLEALRKRLERHTRIQFVL